MLIVVKAVARLRQFEEESNRKTRQLVISISANFSSEDHKNLVSYSKFDAVIPKPINIADLKNAIIDYKAGRLPLSSPI